MVDLTMEKGTRAVEHFLYHKYTGDEVSLLMDISLRISQLESGRTELLLMSPEIPITFLTQTWATNMRSFMGGKNQLTIECSNQWTIDSACRNYELIMKVLAGCGLSRQALRPNNVARCAVAAFTAADETSLQHKEYT